MKLYGRCAWTCQLYVVQAHMIALHIINSSVACMFLYLKTV